MWAITRSGQEVEDWLRRLSCLNVKRDRLRAIFIGEEAINGCEDDMGGLAQLMTVVGD